MAAQTPLVQRVTCDWANHPALDLPVRKAIATWTAYVFEALVHHQGHANDLTECDVWRCVCGSSGNFHPCNEMGDEASPDELRDNHHFLLLMCDSCERIFDHAGYMLAAPMTCAPHAETSLVGAPANGAS